ncbi:MAG: response regulator [Chitinophagaceae bacterium]|nr:response regulator [Chitinophagaceae bacterium]
MPFKQIFLIDDDIDDQELFISALKNIDQNVDCRVSGNGQDALRKLNNREVIPNLIFLDLNMPLMNGHEFLQRIKKDESLKHIPVFVFTTSRNPRTIEDVKKLGAQDLITKPNSFNELLLLLRPIVCE